MSCSILRNVLRVACRLCCLTVVILLASMPVSASEGPTDVGWSGLPLQPWKSPVASDAVIVNGGTEIRWQPLPFAFAPGDSPRFIDFAAGADDNDGRTRDTPWKHHPWDANARAHAAAAKGSHTYVFKGGVTYRGALVGRESGTAAAPIRLTCDPAWGDGPAILAGSVGLTDGWTRIDPTAAAEAGVPAAARENVWTMHLPGEFVPRAMWRVDVDGDRTRLPLARWPNWRIEHPYDHFTQWHRVESIGKGFPDQPIFAPKVLNDPNPNAFSGATIWVDHTNTSNEFSIMGPFPSAAKGYDPTTGRLLVTCTHPRRHPQPNAPFFLENLPRFLDERDEWYFDAASRKLYLVVSAEQDPNRHRFEAARHLTTVELVDAKHIEIAGLAFSGGNCPDLALAPEHDDYNREQYTSKSASILLTGDCRFIDIAHITIHHSAGTGIANRITQASDIVSDIRIRDSRFEHIDNDGIRLVRGLQWRRTQTHPKARLTRIEILRNKMFDIGLRCSEPQGGKGIDLVGPEILDVAGNVIERTAAQAINIHGGRPAGGWMREAADTPLVRIQVRHNQVKDTLLHKTDFGGIEFWAQGPAYVYNNISINPVGFVAHRDVYHKNAAFYFDHGIKAYLFNNIGWSEPNEHAHLGVIGGDFFKEVRNRWNMAFHNTATDMRVFQSHEGAHGDQQYYLGNLAIDIRSHVFSFWRLGEAESIGFANNLVSGSPRNVYDRWRGDTFRTLDEMQRHVGSSGNMVAHQVGWATDEAPVVDAQDRDFRPTDSSAVIDRGVRVFVPWSLYATVGEWDFRLQPKQPGVVLSSDLYPQTHHNDWMLYQIGSDIPGNELTGNEFTADDYICGVLEDWNQGAIRFSGTNALRIPHARLAQDVQISTGPDKGNVIQGSERRTVDMGTNNFLLEAVFQANPGADGGIIAGKMDADAGYALELDTDGYVVVRIRTGGQDARIRSRAVVSDGCWHHVLAEVDRAKHTVAIYVDGLEATAASSDLFPAAEFSLTNGADFLVGNKFRGALDFLRVCRGTLADAETTIEELMTWQFKGPHFHDFTGRAPTGASRDIGALEHPTIAGRQDIRHAPSATETKPVAEAENSNGGDNRVVHSYEWGSLSVPRSARRGDLIDVHISFATETIDRPQTLQVDLHGYAGAEKLSTIARAAPHAVVPGATTPYVSGVKVPQREDLTAIEVVFYVSPDGTYGAKIIGDIIRIELIR